MNRPQCVFFPVAPARPFLLLLAALDHRLRRIHFQNANGVLHFLVRVKLGEAASNAKHAAPVPRAVLPAAHPMVHRVLLRVKPDGVH